MQNASLSFIYFLLIGLFVVVSHKDAGAVEKLNFKYSPNNTVTYRAVINALPEQLATYRESFPNSNPSMAIAEADLNQDGRSEIIAVLNGIDEFCKPGPTVNPARYNQQKSFEQSYMCPHFVFTKTSRGLIKIGEFETVGIMIADTTTNGIKDIITLPDGTNRYKSIIYKWAGRSYKPAQ